MTNPFLGASLETALSYTHSTRCPVPLPMAECDLPTVTAEPYYAVPGEPTPALEGPAYDRNLNLIFVDVYTGRILKLSTRGEVTTVFSNPVLRPAGIAIHRDGRIFVAEIGDFHRGSIFALDPEGGSAHTIVDKRQGYVPDDLVFDQDGGIYFTDFKGSTTNPAGGVFYVSPDFRSITPVLPGMAAANGVALSPDGKILWATEFCAGRLHRVNLMSPTEAAHFGTSTPYHFTARAPDSMRIDADGNVYVAMYDQGRVLVFNRNGIPIGQILIPGREDGRFLKSTSMAFVPASREMVIVSRDEHGGGAMIFRAQGLARGIQLFSHQ